jgi:hypothetical protein
MNRTMVQELADVLECEPKAVKVYIRELFPGMDMNGITPELAREKKRCLYEKLLTLLKEGCSTHEQIAARLGISDRLLIQLLGGHVFTRRTCSEADETLILWPRAGVSMNRAGKLEILPPKEPPRPGTLLSYPAGAALERGVRP